MRTNLWDDPRVARLCDLTDQGEAAVVGGLYWLWAMADEHTEDGLLPGLTARAIDRKTGVNGLGNALISIGWLSAGDAGVSIVHFDEHNGASAKKRCSTAKRVASHRSGNDEVTQPALHKNPEFVTGALAREEKIREEQEEDTAKTGSADSSPPSIADAGANGAQTSQPLPDTCPHQNIIALYHAALPMGRQVRDWTPARAQNLKARWREDKKRQALAWWEKFFHYVAQSAFLTGKTQSQNRRPFELSLDWLVKSENFVKTLEGAYHEAEVTA